MTDLIRQRQRPGGGGLAPIGPQDGPEAVRQAVIQANAQIASLKAEVATLKAQMPATTEPSMAAAGSSSDVYVLTDPVSKADGSTVLQKRRLVVREGKVAHIGNPQGSVEITAGGNGDTTVSTTEITNNVTTNNTYCMGFEEA